MDFPRSHRLTRESDLRDVMREGKRIRTKHLEVRARASLLLHPRIGIIVPKYGRTSVDRNRLKRQLRELVRTEMLPVVHGLDIVVRALSSAYGMSFSVLRGELADVVLRLPSA